ncbi:MAG TPA: hypothetical protein VIB79_12035 [Candidatus Binatia bacterium]
MNDWYQRMVAALQLNGKGDPTQKAYTRAVRMLCDREIPQSPVLYLHRPGLSHPTGYDKNLTDRYTRLAYRPS